MTVGRLKIWEGGAWKYTGYGQKGATGPQGATGAAGSIADGSVTTAKLANFAVTRGVYNYTAGTVTLTNTNEIEIGSITATTNLTTDSVWIWSQVTVTQYGTNVSKGSQPVGLKFRIRRDSLSGTEIGGGTGYGYLSIGSGGMAFQDTTPIVCIANDVPGGSVGSHVYKLSVQCSNTPDLQNAIVGYRTLMAIVRSK